MQGWYIGITAASQAVKAGSTPVPCSRYTRSSFWGGRVFIKRCVGSIERITEIAMSFKLFVNALSKFVLGVVLVGGLLFWPAGTLRYWNGWLLMVLLFIPMFCAGIVMMCRNPALLQSRLDAKEKQKEQSAVVKLSGLMFIIGFVLAGFGIRFG